MSPQIHHRLDALQVLKEVLVPMIRLLLYEEEKEKLEC